MDKQLETAVFGGGCFWCTEAVFQNLRGVEKVTSGYAGGDMDNPSYEDVVSGRTGHAEVIKVEFDPSVITFGDLLSVFFATHDPTTRNQQGADQGTQYRSIILYATDLQRQETEKFIRDNADAFDRPIVTEIKPLEKFFEAEDYHKEYYRN